MQFLQTTIGMVALPLSALKFQNLIACSYLHNTEQVHDRNSLDHVSRWIRVYSLIITITMLIIPQNIKKFAHIISRIIIVDVSSRHHAAIGTRHYAAHYNHSSLLMRDNPTNIFRMRCGCHSVAC